MSARNQYYHIWTGLYMASTASAVALGLYAKKRNKFRKDFTYNKYHFGCAVQILSAVGMSASAKLPVPY